MGNSSSSTRDSRPAREREIERDYEKEKRKIASIKTASVDELKAALADVNVKTRELKESAWTIERLNAQIDSINQLNLQLNQQVAATIQKYNTAVLVFSGMVCIATVLFLWLLVQRLNPSIDVTEEAYFASVPISSTSGYERVNDVDPGLVKYAKAPSSSAVTLVSHSSLIAALRQSSLCPSTTSDNVCSASSELFEAVWQTLRSERVPVSYSTLLSLVTSAFAPSLSLGLVGACVGVLFATLAASFSVLFFWSGWDGPTQLLSGLLYMLGFTASGVYMHQSAKDPALQIPGGTLVALGCCSVYLVVLAIFKTVHATSATPGTSSEKKHREYREDPMFRFVAVIAVGVTASACLRIIPFAPLGLVIVSAGGWFVIFSIALCCDDTNFSVWDSERKLVCGLGLGVLVYAIGIWILFNPKVGLLSLYTMFPKGLNEVYPVVTDVGLWFEWTACIWGFLGLVAVAAGTMAQKSHSDNEKFLITVFVSAAVYVLSLGAIFGGVHVGSLAVAVVGHLGVLFFNCISLSVPLPLLLPAYSGLLFVSYSLQEQSVALVGPIETLSNVLLGPLGVLMLTFYASAVTTGNKSFMLPAQALIMNITMLAWGAYISRTLLFLVGLVGIAVFIIHVGLTFMKGSASFVLLLVVMSFVVASLGVLSQ